MKEFIQLLLADTPSLIACAFICTILIAFVAYIGLIAIDHYRVVFLENQGR